MNKYLGETEIELINSNYATYEKQDFVLMWMKMYKGIDGEHHKDWLLDQIARILRGVKVVLVVAKWEDGTEEERFSLGEPTELYNNWVAEVKSGEHGPDTYGYKEGTAP